jgi:replicative DNA helicase
MMRGYQIIFVDYLQLLQGSGENRTTQVTQISIALHTLAQSMGVTVVALSQLARQGKQDKNTPPDMSALRESGQIEQDADLIMMLSLQDKDNPAGPRELRIRKNKEGTCPNILLDFDGKHQTFRAANRSSDVMQDLIDKGKKFKRYNRQAAQQVDQMTLLSDQTYVPFN